MKTVKKMYGTYMYERYLFAKEKDRFGRKLKRVTKQLELSGNFITLLCHVLQSQSHPDHVAFAYGSVLPKLSGTPLGG